MTQTALTHSTTLRAEVGGQIREVAVVTTWHATAAEARARVASVAGAVFGKVFPGGILGKFRAVTWE